MNARFLLVLTIGFLTSVVQSREPPADNEKFEGTWNVISIEGIDMKPVPPEIIKAGKIVFKGERVSVVIAGETEEFDFKLNSSKKPKAIEFGRAPGIYLVEGDDLKLCWDANGKVRPEEFSIKGSKDGGPDFRLWVLRRAKK